MPQISEESPRSSCDGPLVTVLLTCWNREATVVTAIESALNQTYRNLEIVVVDDASTDNSWQMICSIQDHRIIKTRRKVNGGQNAALNTGQLVAQGDYIAFLDSDDTYGPYFLQTMLGKFDSPEWGFVYSLQGIQDSPPSLESHSFTRVLVAGRLTGLGMIMAKSEAFKSICPLPEMPQIRDMCQDDRICMELSRKYSFNFVPKNHYIVGTADNQVTSDYFMRARGWEIFFDDYSGDVRELAGTKRLAFHYTEVVTLFLLAGSHGEAFRVYLKATRELKNPILLISYVAYHAWVRRSAILEKCPRAKKLRQAMSRRNPRND